MSFVSRIRWQGLYSGTEAALSIPGPYRDTVSYARLNLYISNVCWKLQSLGVVPGSLWGLHLSDTLLNIVATLAIEQMGAASVSVPEAEHVETWPLAGILSDADNIRASCPVEQVDLNWLQGEGGFQGDERRLGRGANDLCRIILTSGSTGRPKGVAYTHRMVEERISRFAYAFGEEFATHKRMLCCMGLSSALGYLFLMYTLGRGGMFCVPDPSIDRTARKVSLYNIQNVVASPLTLGEFWAVSETDELSFRSLELILTAGSLLPRILAEQLRANVCNRMINLYGSAEAGVVATAPVEALDLDNGEVGFVVPDVHVDIVDAQTGAVMTGGGGKVRIRSQGNARSYFGVDGSGTGTFAADTFYPGDQGYVAPNRMLSIFGRDNNVVNLGGVKTTIEQIDAHLSGAPGVAELATVLIDDGIGIKRTVAFVVPAAEWSERAFWDWCHRHVAREFWPFKLVASQRLPRGATGKVDRQRLSHLL